MRFSTTYDRSTPRSYIALTDDLKAFNITEGQWKTLAKDRSRWCERVSQGAEVFMS